MFVHHGCSMPVGRGIGDGASDEGFCGGKWDGSWRRAGGGGCCFRQFDSGLVGGSALMTWIPDEGGRCGYYFIDILSKEM